MNMAQVQDKNHPPMPSSIIKITGARHSTSDDSVGSWVSAITMDQDLYDDGDDDDCVSKRFSSVSFSIDEDHHSECFSEQSSLRRFQDPTKEGSNHQGGGNSRAGSSSASSVSTGLSKPTRRPSDYYFNQPLLLQKDDEVDPQQEQESEQKTNCSIPRRRQSRFAPLVAISRVNEECEGSNTSTTDSDNDDDYSIHQEGHYQQTKDISIGVKSSSDDKQDPRRSLWSSITMDYDDFSCAPSEASSTRNGELPFETAPPPTMLYRGVSDSSSSRFDPHYSVPCSSSSSSSSSSPVVSLHDKKSSTTLPEPPARRQSLWSMEQQDDIPRNTIRTNNNNADASATPPTIPERKFSINSHELSDALLALKANINNLI